MTAATDASLGPICGTCGCRLPHVNWQALRDNPPPPLSINMGRAIMGYGPVPGGDRLPDEPEEETR